MSDLHGFGAEFMDDYFAECEEHLAMIRRVLLELEAAVSEGRGAPASAVEDLFRSFHSIKGISGMVELREAEMLAHHMESYLRLLRSGEGRLSSEGIDALVSGVDALERTIAARRNEQAAPPIEQVVQSLEALATAPSAAPTVAARSDDGHEPSWRLTFMPSSALLARGVNVDVVRARLREAGRIVSAAPRIVAGSVAFDFEFAGELDDARIAAWREDGIVAERLVGAPADAAAPLDAPEAADAAVAETSRLAPSHVVRVDLTRLDELMRIVGDLVISRARLDDALARIEARVPAVEWRAVQEHGQTIERQLRDLREGLMRVRLVPVGEIFRRMPFVVRDLARDSGKRVRLDIRGQETEIDKFLIERMMDPVLHLVRNAVSHGIEPPELRSAAGKPEQGTVTLAAASVGDTVLIEVADDGRGVDAAAVVARAKRLGVPAPDEIDATTLLDLICAPGFSTREEIDRVSGRGVGMDVVKTTIEELNGRLSLQSTPGEGARFVIELPLTLSITDALIAHVGDRTFAVPQGNVREVLEVDPASVRALERQEIAPFRGTSLPIVRLGRVFGIAERPRRALHVLVVGAGPDAVGVAVDRVSGQREIVVRSMADRLVKATGIAGATDLGDGRAVLILNLPDLARHARAAAHAGGH